MILLRLNTTQWIVHDHRYLSGYQCVEEGPIDSLRAYEYFGHDWYTALMARGTLTYQEIRHVSGMQSPPA